MISGFPHDANEICFLLGVYVANSGNFVRTFRDNLSTPFSSIKQSKETALYLKAETTVFPPKHMYRINIMHCVKYQKNADLKIKICLKMQDYVKNSVIDKIIKDGFAGKYKIRKTYCVSCLADDGYQ